jgi:PHP family Zn ribbon phosphoesterase
MPISSVVKNFRDGLITLASGGGSPVGKQSGQL